jgi:hypothetical protein
MLAKPERTKGRDHVGTETRCAGEQGTRCPGKLVAETGGNGYLVAALGAAA